MELQNIFQYLQEIINKIVIRYVGIELDLFQISSQSTLPSLIKG